MRRVLPMGVLLMLLLAPAASACETEVARLVDGEAPSPEGLSPAKDAAIREATTIAEFGQETARWMLWRVLMGEEFTEAEIAEEIDRAMIRNGSNPIWPSFETIVASGPNGASRTAIRSTTVRGRASCNRVMWSWWTSVRGCKIGSAT